MSIARPVCWRPMTSRGPGRWSANHLTRDGDTTLCGLRRPSIGSLFRLEHADVADRDCGRCHALDGKKSAKPSHRRILTALRQGARVTTADDARPVVVHPWHAWNPWRPRRKTLDEMVEAGLVHHVLNWHRLTNPSVRPDEDWHLGPGGDVEARYCDGPGCLHMACPLCHPCFLPDAASELFDPRSTT